MIFVAHDRRLLLVLAAAALGWVLLTAARPLLHAGDGLAADYFTNSEWNGPPAFSVTDAQPSTATMHARWNRIPPERFSVRWTGFLTVGRAGQYTFATTSDDGSQLIIDNRVVVDNSGPHGGRTRSGTITLDAGPHPVVLRYEQFGAIALLEWSWAYGGADSSPVPAWVLSQNRATYAAALSGRIVDWIRGSFAILWAIAFLLYFRIHLRGSKETVFHWFDDRWRRARKQRRQTVSLMFAVVIWLLILFLPWPDGGLFRSAEITIRNLNTTAMRVLGNFRAFQADINHPQTGERVLPIRVQEMLTMLRGHGVEEYRVSPPIAEDAWGFQQIVASAWPRKLEKAARASFVLNVEPVAPGCVLIEKQTEVSLVDCP